MDVTQETPDMTMGRVYCKFCANPIGCWVGRDCTCRGHQFPASPQFSQQKQPVHKCTLGGDGDSQSCSLAKAVADSGEKNRHQIACDLARLSLCYECQEPVAIGELNQHLSIKHSVNALVRDNFAKAFAVLEVRKDFRPRIFSTPVIYKDFPGAVFESNGGAAEKAGCFYIHTATHNECYLVWVTHCYENTEERNKVYEYTITLRDARKFAGVVKGLPMVMQYRGYCTSQDAPVSAMVKNLFCMNVSTGLVRFFMSKDDRVLFTVNIEKANSNWR